MTKHEVKTLISDALKLYYDKGLTNTANELRSILHKKVDDYVEWDDGN